MARRKQTNPMQRIPSGEVMQDPPDDPRSQTPKSNGHLRVPSPRDVNGHLGSRTISQVQKQERGPSRGSFIELVICVGGIYASLYEGAHIACPESAG